MYWYWKLMLVTIVALIFILDLYPTTGNIYFSSKVRVDSFGEGAGKSVLLTNQSHHVAVVTRCSIFEVCWIVFRDHHQFSLSLSEKDLRFIQKHGNNEIYFWKKTFYAWCHWSILHFACCQWDGIAAVWDSMCFLKTWKPRSITSACCSKNVGKDFSFSSLPFCSTLLYLMAGVASLLLLFSLYTV